jgi:UrcA family protein
MSPIDASALFGPRPNRGRRSLPAPLRAFLGGALAALAASALTFPNMASASEPKRVTVHYGDLDLTATPGIARLERRLAAAARRVCIGPEAARNLVFNARRCITEVVSAAYPQIEQAVARQRGTMMVSVRPADIRSH